MAILFTSDRVLIDLTDEIRALRLELHMGFNEVDARLSSFDAPLKNIEDGVKALLSAVKPGMTEEEVALVQAKADAFFAKLNAVADETPDAPTA